MSGLIFTIEVGGPILFLEGLIIGQGGRSHLNVLIFLLLPFAATLKRFENHLKIRAQLFRGMFWHDLQAPFSVY